MTARTEVVNPLTLLGAVLVIDAVLLVSLDAPSALGALAAEVLLAPIAAVPAGPLVRRLALLVASAALLAVTVALYGRSSGPVLLAQGPVVVSGGSLQLALATGLRVVALGLPAAVLLAGLDPTRLGEALAQRLHLSARFVLPAVAATRLVGVLGEDRATAALARRARGLGDRRLVAASAVGLLAIAVRRGSDLATAMEARGLGAPGPRTWSRPSRFGWPDAVVAICAVLVVAAALGAGLTAGTYRAVLAP